MSDQQSSQDSLSPQKGTVSLRLDCRHYLGDRPCQRGCQASCEHYEPMGHRIVIIKLGALGDVIRTESLLPGLKASYPQSHITWISRANGCRMLANNPLIDRLLEFDSETICHVEYEQFDLLINLDKEAGPAALAERIQSPDKRGVGLSRHGTAYPLNPEAHYYFSLGLSDHLKFNVNQYSYQKLIYDALGLTYNGERYALYPSAKNQAHARHEFERAGAQDGVPVIGLNTGAGRVFANKTWPAERFAELAKRLLGRGDCAVALLGGPEEIECNDWIASEVGQGILHLGCHHSELDFVALVQRCNAILTGDTTAMHVGIAMRVPTVVLFGPTCHQEVDLYGRGHKLISKIECAPCYKRTCDISPSCMDKISVESAESLLVGYLQATPQRGPVDSGTSIQS